MEKVISIVGAGGKTTLVHKLAREYHRRGKGVLVTTTTHMYVEADTDLSCDFFALRDKIIKDGYCMAGQKISGQKISEQSKPKMCGLPYDLLDKLIKDMPQELDYVIIEADGAKHHSLKYPAADEPVIYPGTTDIIIVLGTWEKGRLCKDVVLGMSLCKRSLERNRMRWLMIRLLKCCVRSMSESFAIAGLKDEYRVFLRMCVVVLNSYKHGIIR